MKLKEIKNISTFIEYCKDHIFAILLITYFIIMSGVIYDMIIEPPAVGGQMGADGVVRPESIMKGRQNGQYSIEGLTAGLFFIMIGGGMVMIDKGFDKDKGDLLRKILLFGGAIIVGIGLMLISLYSHIKFSP